MKKYKVLFTKDAWDEWGRPEPKFVEYVLANSKKEILATFDPAMLEDVEIYTEAEAVADSEKCDSNAL